MRCMAWRKNSVPLPLALAFIAALLLLPPPPAAASDLTEEVRVLRDRLSSMEERLPRIDLLNWFDLELNKSFDPALPSTFDVAHLYFIYNAQPREGLHAYSEVEYEHGVAIDENGARGKLLIEQLWFTHTEGARELKFGKFLLPSGIWVRNHWVPLTPTVTSPLLYTRQIFPESGTGVGSTWSSARADGLLQGGLYVVNGRGPRENDRDGDENKALGGFLQISGSGERLLGLSAMGGRDATAGAGETLLSFFARAKLGDHLLTVEAAADFGANEEYAWYLQDTVRIRKRLDLTLRGESHSPDAVAKGNVARRGVIALKKSFNENLQFKLEYNRQLEENPARPDGREIRSSLAVLF